MQPLNHPDSIALCSPVTFQTAQHLCSPHYPVAITQTHSLPQAVDSNPTALNIAIGS
jgi:hypothetical protein